MSWKNCPTCSGSNIRCVDSRFRLDRTVRRYICECGARFSTLEEIAELSKGGYAKGNPATITALAKGGLLKHIEETLTNFSTKKSLRKGKQP